MGNERIQHVDADTGAKILQLTSFPNLHWLMGPTPDAITPDGSALLLQANSAPVRNAGRDLWRVNADGSDLEPALEGAGGGVITTDGRWIVTSHPRGDGTALVRIPLAGGGAEEIAAIRSGEDTVRKAVNLAYWNFHGEWAPTVDQAAKERWQIDTYRDDKPAGRGQFDVPDAPRPPASFSVRTRTVDVECGGIELRWSMEAETDPDFDTGVPDFSHYRIYRQEGSRLAPWEVIAIIPAYHLATAETGEHGVDFAGRIYYDHKVTAGADTWYAVVAVDDGSQNWAEPGVPLESSRWWTWTGYSEDGAPSTTMSPGPGCFTRAESRPAKTFALHPAVPNPFNPRTTLRFSIAEAGAVRLAVYDVNGRWVRGLVDGRTDAGDHSVVWDGTDDALRPVASGVYLVRLKSGKSVSVRRVALVR